MTKNIDRERVIEAYVFILITTSSFFLRFRLGRVFGSDVRIQLPLSTEKKRFSSSCKIHWGRMEMDRTNDDGDCLIAWEFLDGILNVFDDYWEFIVSSEL
jgi:hypothetical protein